MIIAGIQKTSLQDFPGRISAIIFTAGCNFRCSYCHNWELIQNREAILSQEKILEFLETRKGKLDGITITGGEPTIHKDLPEFISKLKNLDFDIKLDTNGTNPNMIEELINKNLIDYVAMDIKAPFEKHHLITPCSQEQLEDIKKSIKLLLNSNIDYEFRTTAYPILTEEDFILILDQIKGAKKYIIQQFKNEVTYSKEAHEKVPLRTGQLKIIKETLEKLKKVKKIEIKNV